MKSFLFLVIFLCLVGCVVTGKTSIRQRNSTVEESEYLFTRNQPSLVSITSNISVKFLTKNISMLGVAEVRPKDYSFSLAAMNMMGLKVFSLKYANNQILDFFARDILNKYKNIERILSQDAEILFFDSKFMPIKEVHTAYGKRVYLKSNLGQLICDFDVNGNLISKVLKKGFFKVYKINYMNYINFSGYYYPEKIVLKNLRYGYTLNIVNKGITYE